jgi:hypothetical protein
MRTKLFFAGLALSGAAAIGLSKDAGLQGLAARAPFEHHEHGHELAEKVLREKYAGVAQVHILDSFEVNGVKVFNAAIVCEGIGEAKTSITATGEILTAGLPQPLNGLPPLALETARLFKTPATAVAREDIQAYYFEVKGPGGLPFNVELDAAGRIRDIKSSQEIFEDALEEKQGGPMHRRMTEVALRRFPGIVISNIYKAKHDPGYYHVSFSENGRRGWAIMNPENDVTEWRIPLHHDKVPVAVVATIEHELRGNKVADVQVGGSRVYQIKQLVAGEQIVMLVKPNGTVDWINTRELHRHFLAVPGR